ncbi:unnamed protein product [Arabis nemorensis]|uniref:Uncharacterized protein n=1 Tax=Arabis nemorensis TaxID=586526 RepID=A0A565BPF7_9BRAS|nr:unnamed protein product [Arabis nemorensis]
MFVERRMSLQKSHRKILAAYYCDCGNRPRLLPKSRFKGDEEIVFLHCNDAQRASMMTCDGLVCFPERLGEECRSAVTVAVVSSQDFLVVLLKTHTHIYETPRFQN